MSICLGSGLSGEEKCKEKSEVAIDGGGRRSKNQIEDVNLGKK